MSPKSDVLMPYIPKLKKHQKVSVSADNKQCVLPERKNQKPVQQDSSQSHYDSDTEAETTDDERKVDSSFLDDTDDLLNNDKKTFSNIPKHIKRRKRHILEAVAGPSSRKVSVGAVDVGCEEFNTQDLLSDL
jgi:hypothetical protein